VNSYLTLPQKQPPRPIAAATASPCDALSLLPEHTEHISQHMREILGCGVAHLPCASPSVCIAVIVSELYGNDQRWLSMLDPMVVRVVLRAAAQDWKEMTRVTEAWSVDIVSIMGAK